MIRDPPGPTLFPSTTLSRSGPPAGDGADAASRIRVGTAEVGHASSNRRPEDPDLAAPGRDIAAGDRKSTRLNSSHANISYAVFCLKKKTNNDIQITTHAMHR